MVKQQPFRYLTATWGCQMNDHDTEIIRALLNNQGYQSVDKIEDTDLVVLNTCCVRKSAEQKALGFLGNIKHYKEKNPDIIVAVGGCMTQLPEFRKYLQKSKFVDIIFGTRSFHLLPEMVNKVRETKHQVVDIDLERKEMPGVLPSQYSHPFKAYVNIIYGCDNFCSYCIVPYTRGREKSRPLQEIYKEIELIVRQGYKEITLLGQNVNDYGKDLKGNVDFSTLLKGLENVEGLLRVRYMTSHPRNFTDSIIDTIAGSKKVCEHFHLPLQAGSNKILKLMNRGYKREDYLQKVEKIRSLIPQASITTDLIVGFPGENEDDFAATIDMVQRVGFDAAYTFVYSPRPGTPAAKMSEQVSPEEKKSRIARLIELQKEISLQTNKKMQGKIWEVFVEGKSKNDPELWSGRTRTNKIIIFAGEGDLTGKLVDIRISVPKSWYLTGELLNIKEKEESLPLTRSY